MMNVRRNTECVVQKRGEFTLNGSLTRKLDLQSGISKRRYLSTGSDGSINLYEIKILDSLNSLKLQQRVLKTKTKSIEV